jgi:molecular chaperone GrpE
VSRARASASAGKVMPRASGADSLCESEEPGAPRFFGFPSRNVNLTLEAQDCGLSIVNKDTQLNEEADATLRAAAADSDFADGESAPDPDPIAELTAERDALAAEKTELHDRLLRSQAEFQNFRKRVEKEKIEFFEYASTEAVRALLPILDDFERALKAESGDQEFSRGIELIYQRLFESLKKLGLEPMAAAGQPFDPNIHHAVEMVETDEAADHTVLEEYQRGYNFKGRLLRPAMVKVAVEPKAEA